MRQTYKQKKIYKRQNLNAFIFKISYFTKLSKQN